MRKLMIATCLLGTLAGLSACGSRGIMNRDRPDEMAVTRQAPLIIPPDFALVPPAPGAAPTATADSSRQAMEAMFGGPSARSAAETEALKQAGREDVAPGIRSSVGDPASNIVDKGATTRDILAAPEGDGQNARAAVKN
ncbi:hypothetical protein GCM10007897_24870 [Sphingobium jiangsuense]|uniref:DUF3035 domain-containing protein n=1 Tax=Sphingobium jiangsuense TaxID=870476 RepID=A0A7W6BRH5_9SPHN|nr:DUF3035 domain-containing protein [Sphingobium jiangsuense]MBB3928462.1 hypothetical protein [Sphingobium jiangsuense]GLT01096.1 hypothetical protein GCM10007897_24870 [Sphingobium jiangsuense]